MEPRWDALLIVAFGGPEGPDDVLPFLENVTRGRRIPRERLLQVADHYQLFGGVSPLNRQVRALAEAVRQDLTANGPAIPVYWGNRNWHPYLAETLRQMADDGVRRALALFTSPFGSYSSCRQYLENIEQARAEVGERAPRIEKLRAYFNHPGYIEPMTARLRTALEEVPADRRLAVPVLFTAHSIPVAMARSGPYEGQLREACRLVSEGAGVANWRLVYQSRSGSPRQPWLEPDVCDAIREIAEAGSAAEVVVTPIGFISDHVEVLYDLDVEAKQVCDAAGLRLIRAATVGTHPRFVTMVRELIQERVSGSGERQTLGTLGPAPDECPADCCRFRQ